VAVILTQEAPPRFAHHSEEELARILDFYQIEWRYEPDTFPISWNASGMVVESFAPDFFLPDLGLYLEITTLRQSLVRRKNRKLRLLRQLYPEIRVKLFYLRDFQALMLKYGRMDFLTDDRNWITLGNGAAE
jgi:hypoxanthine phosphoribosyltransferase